MKTILRFYDSGGYELKKETVDVLSTEMAILNCSMPFTTYIITADVDGEPLEEWSYHRKLLGIFQNGRYISF